MLFSIYSSSFKVIRARVTELVEEARVKVRFT